MNYETWYVNASTHYGFLAYIEAFDNHIIRDVQFHDTIFPGNYIFQELSIGGYTIGIVTFIVEAKYEKMFETKGYAITPKVNEY